MLLFDNSKTCPRIAQWLNDQASILMSHWQYTWNISSYHFKRVWKHTLANPRLDIQPWPVELKPVSTPQRLAGEVSGANQSTGNAFPRMCLPIYMILNAGPVLVYGWANVSDVGSTINQHCVTLQCLPLPSWSGGRAPLWSHLECWQTVSDKKIDWPPDTHNVLPITINHRLTNRPDISLINHYQVINGIHWGDLNYPISIVKLRLSLSVISVIS